MTYAYLGPPGTFTEEALRRVLPPSREISYRPFPTVPAALDSVRRGECAGAVVPMENSVKGVVPATLDQFASAGLHITAEVQLPVTFALMALPGTRPADITHVFSHPHALGQCGRWLGRRLPGAQTVTAESTAAAARDVAGAKAAGCAAIAAPLAAELYGLEIVARGIGERDDAVTRFVAVCPEWFPRARTGQDRTSFMVPLDGGGPGALVKILTAFSSREIELTWIQSAPTGDGLGSYRFFIDIEGHIEDPPVRDAVAELGTIGVPPRFLGSYPRVPC
jgi:prephenate dehydratase